MARPKKFNEVKELQKLIGDYFLTITRSFEKYVVSEDWEKIPLLNNARKPIIETEYVEIPSILWMCEFVWIHRDTMLEYEKQEWFSDTIKEAKQRIERYNADSLFREKNVTGIIFNLKNNFGWVDKSEVDSKTINIDVTEEITEEQKKKIAERYL